MRPSRVAVVGGGSIGIAWSIVFARAGATVRLYETNPQRRAEASTDLSRRLQTLARQYLLDEDVAEVKERVQFSSDLTNTVVDCDYVQECVPEETELKCRAFSELDQLVPPEVPIASSSSMIPCSVFANGIPGRERCLVAHPGNPPYLLPIVELVPAPFTAQATLVCSQTILAACGMLPITLHREIDGFVFNRLQGAVLREAYALVRDGIISPEGIDCIVRESLGRRWAVLGPFETAELNTRGGIEAHASRLGAAYTRMASAPGRGDPWEPELVAKVSSDVQRRLPRTAWESHVLQRDQALMILERCRREHSEVFFTFRATSGIEKPIETGSTQ